MYRGSVPAGAVARVAPERTKVGSTGDAARSWPPVAPSSLTPMAAGAVLVRCVFSPLGVSPQMIGGWVPPHAISTAGWALT